MNKKPYNSNYKNLNSFFYQKKIDNLFNYLSCLLKFCTKFNTY